MKFSLAVFFCLLFAVSTFGQTAEIIENNAVKVESITLMRDDGAGDPGDETENFKTTDRPIHVQIQLDSLDSVMVKMILVTIEVKNLKTGTKILTVNYKTNGEQNIVNFKGSPKIIWLAGKYRVEVYIDGKLAGNKEFEIVKSFSAPDKQTNFPTLKSTVKLKPKRKN